MNQATRDKVTLLLDKATFSGFEYKQRMGKLATMHSLNDISTAHYMQLVNAVNTQHQTGSYEGCIIWRNAEVNPLSDTLFERRFSNNEVNCNQIEENGHEKRNEFRKNNQGKTAMNNNEELTYSGLIVFIILVILLPVFCLWAGTGFSPHFWG